MNRKQRRTAEKKRQKNDPEQLMADRIHSFGNLPNECNACQKPFDRKNKEMVFSWSVVAKEERIRLFCPECINKTKKAIEIMETNRRELTPMQTHDLFDNQADASEENVGD
jgi:hypothetical protein